MKTLLWQLVRTLPQPVKRYLFFIKAHRQIPRLRHPLSFNEKVNWRILHDRRPEIAWTCDKLEMKRFAATNCSAVKVPATLWFGDDVKKLAGFVFPDRWILKANHRSHCVFIGNGQPSLEQLEMVTASWMEETEGKTLGEWAYTQARPLIVLEEWIGDGALAPTDYKFYVFDGVVSMILATEGRFGNERTVLYDRDWNRLPASKGPSAYLGELAKPAHLTEMIEIAENLAASFDFMRIDLFDTDTGIYFGETTPYPGGGMSPFQPRSFDRALGDLWSLPTKHN